MPGKHKYFRASICMMLTPLLQIEFWFDLDWFLSKMMTSGISPFLPLS